MTRRLTSVSAPFLVAASATAALLLAASATVRAENDCFRVGPDQVSSVVGSTWAGRLDAVRHSSSDPEISRLTFHVEDVYAGLRSHADRDHLRLQPGEPLTLVYSRCPTTAAPADLGLSIGARYLVSQKGGPSPDSILTANTVVWRIDDHDGSHDEDFYDQPSDVTTVFESTGTLDEALALVTPDSLPPTDAVPSLPPGDRWAVQALLTAMTGATGGALWSNRRRRSAHSSEGSN